MAMSKKMKGFMCHSISSTAVCMPQDRSGPMIVKSAKYVRLGDHRAAPPRIMRRSSFPVSNQEANATSSEKVAVVMRVSIHCEGCAGKVKKHLSRMEGVTSFSVDLETKRVTVIGHVSPSGVLETMSKVMKKAELVWFGQIKGF